MILSRTLPAVAVLALALAACQADAPAESAAAAPTPATDAAAPVDPVADQPADPVPPATAPGAIGSNRAPVADGVITFAGFGPAAFGADQEQVRMAWGNDLGDAQPSEAGGCYYLMPQPVGADGYQLAFMMEGDRFARIDVRSDAQTAPGGGKVGMTADEIEALYPGRVEVQPHKYVEGANTLRVTDADGSDHALVFETDATGAVTQWRIGAPPQVDYVEGCG
ncbi:MULTISPECIES: lectin [Luteimonas]|uniref:lectin n=1 Tax=Luteimonas TaxID=83614 RepID=UPI000C7A902B|nr:MULTISPECIES: lectin [Luteimonas]